jgi:hypothetical protein
MQHFTRVALCNDCWKIRHPARAAARMKHGEPERCHTCGEPTTSGIYIRVDLGIEPAAVDSAEVER